MLNITDNTLILIAIFVGAAVALVALLRTPRPPRAAPRQPLSNEDRDEIRAIMRKELPNLLVSEHDVLMLKEIDKRLRSGAHEQAKN